MFERLWRQTLCAEVTSTAINISISGSSIPHLHPYRWIWYMLQEGWPHWDGFQYEWGSSVLTSALCVRWPWLPLSIQHFSKRMWKSRVFLCSLQFKGETEPFSIFTATVFEEDFLSCPKIEASITFPKAPCPSTFPANMEKEMFSLV